jgi:hypothetical protein
MKNLLIFMGLLLTAHLSVQSNVEAGRRMIRVGNSHSSVYVPARVQDFTSADIDTLKSQVLAMAENYQKNRDYIKRRNAEHTELIDLILTLKEEGLLPPGAYPEAGIPNTNQAAYQAHPQAAQGPSIYGYGSPGIGGVSELITLNNVDLPGLYNQSFNLVGGLQGLHGQIANKHLDLIDNQANYASQLQLEKQRLDSAAELIKASKEQTSTSHRLEFNPSAPKADERFGSISPDQIITTTCLKCHQEKKVKFKLEPWDVMNEDNKKKVRDAVRTGKMPKDGPPLSFDNLLLFK